MAKVIHPNMMKDTLNVTVQKGAEDGISGQFLWLTKVKA